MNKAKEFLKEKGIHTTEPIYWDFGRERISLDELLEEYKNQSVPAIKEGEMEKLRDKAEEVFDKHTAPTGGGYEADYTDMNGFMSELFEFLKPHLLSSQLKSSDAVEFAEWLQKNRWFNFENEKWHYTHEMGTSISDEERDKHYRKTSAELYSKFLSEKGIKQDQMRDNPESFLTK